MTIITERQKREWTVNFTRGDALDMNMTELEVFTMNRANVTIAPVEGSMVIAIETLDPRDDGVYEAKCFVVLCECNINDCRQDAEELGIDLLDARILANRPDTTA